MNNLPMTHGGKPIDWSRINSCLKAPLPSGTPGPNDVVALKEDRPKLLRGWNGWNVESTKENETDYVIVGPEPKTVLQIRADRDTEVNGIHVRFFDPPHGFKAEIGVAVQEWPIGLRNVPIMTVSGPRLIYARRDFPASRKFTPLVMERREHSSPHGVPQKLWGWIRRTVIRYSDWCIGTDQKVVNHRKWGPPCVRWPQDYWKWVGCLKVFYGRQCLGIVVMSNLPCPCKVTISGR